MDAFRLSYWVTFSIVWVMIATFVVFGLFFLVTRCFLRRRSSSGIDSIPEDPFSGGPRGVDPAIIESFPKITYTVAQGKEVCGGMMVCVICLGVFKEGETLRSLPSCSHMFHSHCVDAWLKTHATCPCCRASVVPLPGRSGLLKMLPAGLARLV